MSLENPTKHSPEIEKIEKLRECFKNHPQQINKLNTSDCEVIKIGNQFLVSNLDTLSEEVELGLYKNPKTIGSIAAIACLSDLASCGVTPNHIMQSITWSRSYTPEQKIKLQSAYSDTLDHYKIQLSGGDTSDGPFTSITSMAQALCDKTPLSRNGGKPGDYICLIGHLGDGPALAMSYLLGLAQNGFNEEDYLPKAYLDEGLQLNSLASACIDTSDGLITALNHLKNINHFEFDLDLDSPLYSQTAQEFIDKHNLNKFLLWIVEHGDYQLLTIIPPENIEKAKKEISNFSVIGKVTNKAISSLKVKASRNDLDLENLCKALYSRRHEPSEHLIELNNQLNMSNGL